MTRDLNLALSAAPAGRPNETSSAFVRHLTEADIVALKDAPYAMPEVTKMRDRHHKLAQAVASGMPLWQAAQVASYDISRVVALNRNTAFRDLVAYYQNEKRGMFEDLGEAMVSLATDATNELRDRLEENPESFDNRDLMELTKTFADRSGYGPKSTTKIELNVGLASRLEEARKRIAQAKVIDAEVINEV